MLSSINPFVERARTNRWWLTVAAHVVGATLGGALAGALLGGFGSVAAAKLSDRVALTLGGVVCVVAAVAQPLTRWRPGWRRQVDEDWMTRYRGWVYGLGFGVQLGAGVATHVTSTAVYAALGLAVLQRSILGGMIVGAVFGWARGSVLIAGAPIHDPDRLRRFFIALARRRPLVDRTVFASLFVVGIAAVVLA